MKNQSNDNRQEPYSALLPLTSELIVNKSKEALPADAGAREQTVVSARAEVYTSNTIDIFGAMVGNKIAGKYRVKRILKAGGMGLVVAAEHEYLNKMVAIKIMLPSLVKEQDNLTRFIREAQTVARLKSEHVARVMDVGILPIGVPFVVMEFLRGIDLEDLLLEQGPLSVSLTVDMVLQISDAICEAHGFGMVHRDLKPSNIFLLPRPSGIHKVKVLDFGIVKNAGVPDGQHVSTNPDHILGSPFYMSPEQMRESSTVDHRADIWSLGVILYECLTGRRPFYGQSMGSLIINVLAEEPLAVSSLRSGLPTGLQAIVHRCLEKEPQARFQSVVELRDALLSYATCKSTAFFRARRSSEQPAALASVYPPEPFEDSCEQPAALASVYPPEPFEDSCEVDGEGDAKLIGLELVIESEPPTRRMNEGERPGAAAGKVAAGEQVTGHGGGTIRMASEGLAVEAAAAAAADDDDDEVDTQVWRKQQLVEDIERADAEKRLIEGTRPPHRAAREIPSLTPTISSHERPSASLRRGGAMAMLIACFGAAFIVVSAGLGASPTVGPATSLLGDALQEHGSQAALSASFEPGALAVFQSQCARTTGGRREGAEVVIAARDMLGLARLQDPSWQPYPAMNVEMQPSVMLLKAGNGYWAMQLTVKDEQARVTDAKMVVGGCSPAVVEE